MANDLTDIVEPNLDASKATILVMEGLIGYVNRSSVGGSEVIESIVLHGKYAPWALRLMNANRYESASVSDSKCMGGISGGVWSVDVDALVESYGGH